MPTCMPSNARLLKPEIQGKHPSLSSCSGPIQTPLQKVPIINSPSLSRALGYFLRTIDVGFSAFEVRPYEEKTKLKVISANRQLFTLDKVDVPHQIGSDFSKSPRRGVVSQNGRFTGEE